MLCGYRREEKFISPKCNLLKAAVSSNQLSVVFLYAGERERNRKVSHQAGFATALHNPVETLLSPLKINMRMVSSD